MHKLVKKERVEMKTSTILVIMIFAFTVAAGCCECNDVSPTNMVVTPSHPMTSVANCNQNSCAVKISPHNPTTAIGGAVRFMIDSDQAVAWSTSGGHGSIDSSGRFEATSAGTDTIIASYGGQTIATTTVTVESRTFRYYPNNDGYHWHECSEWHNQGWKNDYDAGFDNYHNDNGPSVNFQEAEAVARGNREFGIGGA